MREWIQHREETIVLPDRELRDIWFERGHQVLKAAAKPALIIASGGSAIKDAVVKLIRGADQMLVVGSFLIGSEDIVEEIEHAAGRGVRTYVLSASLEQLKVTKRALTEDDQQQVDAHQELLDRLARSALVRAAPGFHAKFVLVDPFGRGSGLLLTANLRDGAMRSNDEIAVPIGPKLVMGLAIAIRWSLWEAATHQMTEPGRLAAVGPLGKVPWTAPAGSLTTTQWSDDITQAALGLLDIVTAPVLATSFTWAPGNPVAQRLCELARAGGDVTVMINPLTRSAVEAARVFSQSGCTVLGRERMHAKAVSVGGERGVVHTLNFDDMARPSSTLDVGVLLDGAKARELHRVLEHWADLAPYEFAASRRLADAGGSVIRTNGRPVRQEIPATMTVDLGTVVASSADEMDVAARPKVPTDVFAHAINARWAVEPPLLGPRAKPVGISPVPGDASLYRDGGRLVVGLDRVESLPAARALKQLHDAAAIVVDRRSSKSGKRK